ncbi:putative E3 ubiquitin-protein ligase HERC3 isoform 2-T2 [Clarias gariepinus]|uniref:probable E3 ubiquitin-protein ligase HERC3 isoform X2 n=1 Tax=Clarias gariepinus TaxID=13013 RepID=UPI00234D1C59|nr:probable E3 ubiquitin-protein ligase HERC3 isoform X2 [Clarias gariepinus]
MLYWGKLNSTGNDPSHQDDEGSNEIFRLKGSKDVSITEGLATFIRDPDRRVTIVTSQRGNGKQTPYRRMTLDLKKERAAICSAGQKHVVIVTEAGAVWEWKHSTQSNIPRKISSLTNIAQVACGSYHTVVLTKDGQLFTWGQNSSGQLGLGKGEPSSLSPQPLKSLCGIPLAQISAGGDHSFALSLSGAVFGWGRNSAGQLGLGNTDDRHAPVCVKSLNLKKTVFISCGEDHTAVLTKGGLLFTFGSGRYGQLGHNSLRDELLPRVVAEFWGSKVFQIACGGHHTLALVESSNTIYSFGCGAQGQLGNGLRTNQCVPFPVELPPEYSPDQAIKKITAGGNISVLFISDDVKTGSNPSSCNTTAVLNDEMIDRWISPCNSKTWKKKQREIQKMFSSVSCINGSFCEKSGDQHYKTSKLYSGLDLSLARLAFEKLAKKDNVLPEIETVVEKALLPSLSPDAAGVEALRVYLILPELLRVLKKQGRGTQLTVALARAILQLKPESMEVLTSLWTKLPYYYYRTLVKMFHSVCAHRMSLRKTTCDWTEVLPLLKVLQKLYNVGQRSLKDLFLIMRLAEEEEGLIHIDEQLGIFFNVLENTFLYTSYPFILDINSKRTAFRILQLHHGQTLVFDIQNTLHVNRQSVLADTLEYLKKGCHDFSLPLKVKFNLEDGLDYGGVRAGFFTLIGQEITKASRVIQVSEDSGLVWFSADSEYSQEEFFYFGVMCGLAFYNHCFMNIGFPVVLFKKLLDLRLTLRDLEELSPVEARSLKNLLTEDEDVVEELYLDFTIKGKELIPNGAEIPVTKANRQKYVDLYVDFVLNKSVENQFKKFKEGFSRGNPYDFWKMFKPEELRDLLYGTSKYDWEELQKGVIYKQCGPSDELVQHFWSVFFELDEEHKKKFLTFVYGTDRLPVGGISKLRLTITRCNYSDADDRFPSAQTCFGILHLPNYSSIHILQSKLTDAITLCEIFGQR